MKKNESILEAYERIKEIIKETSLEKSIYFSTKNTNLFFKCENEQYTGSFKLRGATNKLTTLSNEDLKNGVFTGILFS
jgi:threonine dehydratase